MVSLGSGSVTGSASVSTAGTFNVESPLGRATSLRSIVKLKLPAFVKFSRRDTRGAKAVRSRCPETAVLAALAPLAALAASLPLLAERLRAQCALTFPVLAGERQRTALPRGLPLTRVSPRPTCVTGRGCGMDGWTDG